MALEIALSPEDRAAILGATAVHGRNYDATRANRVYVAAGVSAGTAILAAHATNGNNTLWNPAGSGRVISIKKLRLAYVSGNNAPGSLCWNITENTGSDLGPAGAAILTGARVAVRSAAGGLGVDSKAIWIPHVTALAAPTFKAAPVYHRPIGLSLFTGVAASAVAPWEWGEDYDGDNLIMPGTA